MTKLFGATYQARKMLIADDDPAILWLLADRCAKMGFEVETATNGVQALIRANRSQPDILTIDINLPEASGLSVCTHLLGSTNNSLNVVVITGKRDRETVEQCENLGAHYVHKGPDFWSALAFVLAEIFPGMTDKIKKQEMRSAGIEVRERPRVLLVDDDPDMETFFSSRLDKWGVDLLYAPNAAQAYRIACREGPSVIVSDYFMPDGDAYSLLWRLRTTPVSANIPVLVISGQRLDEVTERNLRRDMGGRPGTIGLFRKSSDNHDLFEALQKYCCFEKTRVDEVKTADADRRP
jgi:CheY-like chemotaxis protein